VAYFEKQKGIVILFQRVRLLGSRQKRMPDGDAEMVNSAYRLILKRR